MYTDPRMNTELAVILDTLSYEERNSLIEKLANNLMLERKETEHWENRYNEVRDQTVDVTPLNSRIEVLMQDAAYWKSVSEQRQATINNTMLVRGKEQCALGIINLCQPYYKAMLDALFADTPNYNQAWGNCPWQLADAVHGIDKAKKIERIKVVRQWLPGLGLKQAKEFVEAHYDYK